MEFNKVYHGKGHVTIPYIADDELVERVIKGGLN